MNLLKLVLIILFFIIKYTSAFAQLTDRFEQLEEELEVYSKQHENLRQKIDISASGTVKEIVTAIAQQTRINVTIDPNINDAIASNFSKVAVRDVLLYLCRQYNLDIKFSGAIIVLSRYNAPPPVPTAKELGVKYNNFNGQLSIDLERDTLQSALRKISQQSGQNVLASRLAKDMIVTGYVDKAPLETALQLLANANDLRVQRTKEGAFMFLTKAEIADTTVAPTPRGNRPNFDKSVDYEKINNLKITTKFDSLTRQQLVSVEAANVPFIQILKGVSIELGRDYFLFELGAGAGANPNANNNSNFNPLNPTTSPAGATTGQGSTTLSLKVENVTYEDFLNHLLKGTQLTYREDNGIYLIGQRDMEGLRQSKVVQLQYRSAFEIDKVVPKELLTKVNLQPFLELNAVLLSGSLPAILEVESFLKSIDKLVPVVMVELIILDVQRSLVTETGVQMGVSQNPVTNQATLSPGFDFTFNGGAINRLLQLLEGRGIINLGRVVPNFYTSLKAVEEAGITKTRSRPQLATLNSHETSFKITETRYYRESRTTVQGVQGTVTQQDINFKSVQASFNITITPYVAGDEHITLNVVVEQSDFTGELQLNSPPPQTTRRFDSKIRIKNGEMIVLGGLETKRNQRTNKGVPFLARIPILNLFGSKKASKTNAELLIFIKSSVIY